MSRHSERSHAASGFTLMELLLVIAIIAILAALLFPALGGATAKANETKCLSNARQWGTAMTLYLADNGGAFPVSGPDPADPTMTNAWFNVLPPYLGMPQLATAVTMPRPRDKSLFICPAAKPDTAPGDTTTYYSNYAVNQWLISDIRGCSGAGGSGLSSNLVLSQVSKPGSFVVMAESPTGNNGFKSPTTIAKSMAESDPDAFRHNGRANLAFADGHAAGFAKTKIYDASMTIYWNFGGVQWNPDNSNVDGACP